MNKFFTKAKPLDNLILSQTILELLVYKRELKNYLEEVKYSISANDRYNAINEIDVITEWINQQL